ncbi:class I SAM-dependent methyltransferase [bacterium]|nr:class I SAM-dependent methyltransferase [bacterium]
MILQLENIFSDPPLVHRGGTMVWGLNEDVLRYIDDTLKPGAKTLETGAGISTILFAVRSSVHTCIVPSEQEVSLIRDYALRKDISLDHVHFIVDYSQNVLPTLEQEDLDLVLIDGGHGYPIPAIDWFYTAPMLKINGVVIIDDVQLWTGLELKRFLAEEESWKFVRNFARSTAYEKVGQEYAREWTFQPYIIRRSRIPRILNLLRNAFLLLLNCEFSKLATKVRKQLMKG